ncbi:hypothetical protein MPSEU_000205200 [Mayamaea pseudoterrestris]|nr:hypothetical protein MPSEU_000205200 [Mayamaea pseudoterrestris]
MGIDEHDGDEECPSRPHNVLAGFYPFTSWKYSADTCYYADEASLYSIPENSRGEAASEFNSRPPSIAGSDLWDKEPQQTVTVEMPWSSVDEAEKLSNVSTQEGSSGDEHDVVMINFATKKSNQKTRLMTATCVLIVIVLAVSLGVALTQCQNDAEESTQHLQSEKFNATSSVREGLGDGSTPADTRHSKTEALIPLGRGESPTASPPTLPAAMIDSKAPTSSPIKLPHDYGTILIHNFILQALESCTEQEELLNVTTIQGKIFAVLFAEMLSRLATNTDDTVDTFYKYNMGMIAERFGLMMLYEMTAGDEWRNNSQWVSTDDVCNWYGVESCSERLDGGCAAKRISLGRLRQYWTHESSAIYKTCSLCVSSFASCQTGIILLGPPQRKFVASLA